VQIVLTGEKAAGRIPKTGEYTLSISLIASNRHLVQLEGAYLCMEGSYTDYIRK